MQERPRFRNTAETCYRNIHLEQQKKGTAYSSEAIVFNEEPKPIDGDRLKEILHRSVGALTFLNKYKKIAAGTGTLVSENCVLTAAHNIFDKEKIYENTDFKFYLGADGVAEEYYEIEGWRYPEEFKTCHPSTKLTFDYAIMKLKRPIKFDKYLLLSQPCPQCLLKESQSIMLQIFGFPCAYPLGPPYFGLPFKKNFMDFDPQDKYGKKIRLNQYGLARQNRIAIVDASQLKIGYGISTLPGQSGSFVVVGNSIIAVHVGGEIGKEFNVGRIIDSTLINNITEWGKNLNAAPFSRQVKYSCQHNKNTSLRRQNDKVQRQLSIKKDKVEHISDLKKYVSLKNIKKEALKNPKPDTKLQLRSRKLKSIDLFDYVNLVELILHGNELQQIDVTQCPHLKTLDLSINQLQQINLSKNAKLAYLNLHTNKLDKVDVSNNTNLTYLCVSQNKLQKINVTSNINLTCLNLCFNKLTEIDLTNNKKLEWLQLQYNKLALIRLCIVGNVSQGRYTAKNQNGNYQFDFSHQKSSVCLVQLKCDEVEGEAIQQKAGRIAYAWKSVYSGWNYNRNNCAYSYQIS